jgi:hypothetical protein
VPSQLFATIMLGGYPLIILLFFILYRPTKAVALSLLVSELILPPKYSLPLQFCTWLTKWTLPPITVFVALLIFAWKPLAKARPFRGAETSFVIMALACFLTMWTNQDALVYGPTFIAGEKFADFLSDLTRSVSDPWAVFFIGRAMFRSTRDFVMLGRMMAIGALCLVLPILIEIRMSPQFNNWIYGYGTSDFVQSLRFGGYRPQLLFGHGLTLAAFLAACLLVSIGLARAKYSIAGYPAKWISLTIGVTLLICKSMGSILYAVIFAPLLLRASPKRVTTIASVLMMLFMTYPILRWNGVIPTKGISDFFKDISPERAQSLKYRFDMEDGMLDKARERPWFGFGGYGRLFVYNKYNGRSESIPDGVVAMTLAGRGFVTFYAYFFPYALAVLRARLLLPKIRKQKNRMMLAALAMTCAIILFDLIINSEFFPLFMMLFGILYSLPKVMIKEEQAELAEEQAATDPTGYEWAPAVGAPAAR